MKRLNYKKNVFPILARITLHAAVQNKCEKNPVTTIHNNRNVSRSLKL